MQSKAFRRKFAGLILLPVLLLILSTPQAFAQGSIFGSITNSDASAPANGDIIFFGYLDDTDEEIRLETSIGAGFDAGNWFDDFQNYLTEAAGNPYDYHFYNTANGEFAVLSGAIPNNSFQQENVSLAAYAGGTNLVTGMSGVTVSGTSVILTWNTIPGETYHVYRRLATSTGSFFRIDDPAGAISNRGVAAGYFVDNNVDGVSAYHYLIIPEDDAGNLGPMHSAIMTVNTANVAAPALVSISPDNGPFIGGTSVTVTGSEIDMNGAIVTVGGNPLTSQTVVSPFQITGVVPAGTVGPADVVLTNSASGLSSNTLTGGYTYNGNSAPVFDPVATVTGTEGTNVNFVVTANDADGTTPALSATGLPGDAAFVDNGDGTGTFDWNPGYTDAGLYAVTFTADDGIEPANLQVDVDIADAGNQPPVVDPIADQTVAENSALNMVLTASDPDLDAISLSITDAPANSSFTDNGDGTANFDFTPAFDQAGSYDVVFKAFDGVLVDSAIFNITVTEINQVPVLTAIGAQNGAEGVQLTFGVTATDADGTIPTLAALNLPVGAVFTDNGDGTGTFDWTPGFTEAGPYQVTFQASDLTDTAEEIVDITIAEAGNQAPVLDPIGPQAGTEGVNLNFAISGSDPDETIPSFEADNLPTGATLTDNLDGTATFDWTPDFTQAGIHSITFRATDGTLFNEEIVDVTISESGNQAPVFTAQADTTVAEADSLILVMNASDPDGEGVFITVSTDFPVSDYNFVDSGNGVAVFSLGTDYYSAGIYSVNFFATDNALPAATGSESVAVTITEVNQPPVIVDPGPVGVAAGDLLSFMVEAYDSTAVNPAARVFLSATGIPSGASFTDNGDNTATFEWQPDFGQIGVYNMTVIGTDQGIPQLAVQMPVEITVVTENRPPVFDAYPQSMAGTEGEAITFSVSATDDDGNIPTLRTVKIPANSTFTDNGDGTGDFVFNPDFIQSGLHQVVLAAYDGVDETRTDPILIQVIDAGNQAPEIDPVAQQNVTEGTNLTFDINASDPDATTPALTAENLPTGMTFTDNGDGTGTISFDPEFSQSGSYDITITADDGEFQVSTIVTVVVDDAGNQPPVMTQVDPQTVEEQGDLSFTVTSSDPDTDVPDNAVMTVIDLPTDAVYTDNGNGTGTFTWTPDYATFGEYLVSFIATDPRDASLYDSIEVTITVTDVNFAPAGTILSGSGDISIYEGDTTIAVFYGFDPDETIPVFGVNESTPLQPNMNFVDSGNGYAVLTFTPDYNQAVNVNPTQYRVAVLVTDAEDDAIFTQLPTISFLVYDRNRPPVLATTANSIDTSIVEGNTISFQVSISDPDADNAGLNISAEDLPDNSTFTGNQIVGQFSFTPSFTQAGEYTVRFIGTDSPTIGGSQSLADTLDITITVVEAGNQPPVLTVSDIIAPDYQPLIIGEPYVNSLSAVDPEGEAVTITMEFATAEEFATYGFSDNGDGTAVMGVTADNSQYLTEVPVDYTATDASGASTTVRVRYLVVQFIRGDSNTDGKLDMSDIMYIVNYLYKEGPTPASADAADANFDTALNILDAEYLIRFFYKQGPPPPESPTVK